MNKVLNYFSLKTLLKLYNQLHNKPDTMFRTVGEVAAWRDILIKTEDCEQANFYSQISERRAWLALVALGEVQATSASVSMIEQQMKNYKIAIEVESGKRMADIRACQTFFERCGLSF